MNGCARSPCWIAPAPPRARPVDWHTACYGDNHPRVARAHARATYDPDRSFRTAQSIYES
ncbi:BBE domain-containing protein [Streptomyces roseoverticillatus]|uniref:BBE domain-containing protein n=1 Tax=Streptomyces roseoverticillatus TaxID=66429 RepID=UPI0035AB97F8